MKKIPQHLFDRIKALGFADVTHWFYIKHPALNYESPIRCIWNNEEDRVIEAIKYEEKRK